MKRIALLLVPVLLTACLCPPPADDDGALPWTRRLADPVTAPYLFESPVVASNMQFVALRHEFPSDSVFGGGNLDVIALQLRWALTERLALIATKDGWADLEPDVGGDETDDGYADVAAGLKYVLVDDPEEGHILTAGLIYEATNGDSDVLQGDGEGVWRPFLSSGWDRGRTNWLASIGAYLPVDGDAESQFVDWHLHWSYEADAHWLPLVEVNGLHYTDGGRALTANFEGVDYTSLGSSDVEGNDVITGAVGARYRIDGRSDLGFAYEQAISSREDIFDSRITLDYVLRF